MRRKDREVAGRSGISDILNGCRTANVCMVEDGKAYAVPLSYGYDWQDGRLILYFHCAKEGRKLEIIRRNPSVCFTVYREGELIQAGAPCNTGYCYSSVIGNGTARLIEDLEGKKHALSRIYMHQTGKEVSFTQTQADSVCVFQIISEDYTGKQRGALAASPVG